MSETFYDAIGGEKAFEQLVSYFYALVAIDPILRPMYPTDDLHGAAIRLKMFLEQYWGGPKTYSEERGHPRLRMRHAEFKIGTSSFVLQYELSKNGEIYAKAKTVQVTVSMDSKTSRPVNEQERAFLSQYLISE